MLEKEEMMKKKLKKYLLNDFNDSYHCEIKPESIIEKTEFFKKVNIVNSNNPFFRKAFALSSFISLMLIFVVTVLAVSNNRLATTISNWDDLTKFSTSYEPTSQDLAYFQNNCEKLNPSLMYIVPIDNRFDLVVYKGYQYVEHIKVCNVYFYKIVLKKNANIENEVNDLIIKCDNTTKIVNENNTIGILTTTLVDSEQLFDDIKITIINQDIQKDYVLSILNSL